MKTNLSNNFSDLNKTIQDYVKVRIDLVKLSVLEKGTKITVFLISTMVFILIGSIFFIFSSAAFVVWYGNQFHNYLTGLIIVIGVIILLGFFFYLSRRTFITSSVIKNLSSILFEHDDDTD